MWPHRCEFEHISRIPDFGSSSSQRGESKLCQAKKSLKFHVLIGGKNRPNYKKTANSAFSTKKTRSHRCKKSSWERVVYNRCPWTANRWCTRTVTSCETSSHWIVPVQIQEVTEQEVSGLSYGHDLRIPFWHELFNNDLLKLVLMALRSVSSTLVVAPSPYQKLFSRHSYFKILFRHYR